MNFRKRRRADLPEFQFTPMIDVVFLLLCFFITTSVFSQWEYEVDVVLPTAQSGKMPDRLPGEIIINITRDGRLIINRQVLTPAQLRERLVRLARYFPGQPVVVRADRATPYEHVIGVIDSCRLADIWNISFATSAEEQEAADAAEATGGGAAR
jgi:biopolymer transport protein ExbD